MVPKVSAQVKQVLIVELPDLVLFFFYQISAEVDPDRNANVPRDGDKLGTLLPASLFRLRPRGLVVQADRRPRNRSGDR